MGGADQVRSLATVYREAYLRVVQSHYWQAIEEGILPRNFRVTRTLLNSKDAAMDDSWQCLNDWAVIAAETGAGSMGPIQRLIGVATKHRPLCWIPYLRRVYSEDFQTMQFVYVVLSFQEAHHLAQEEVPKVFGTGDQSGTKALEQVAEESRQQCRKAADLLQQLPPE